MGEGEREEGREGERENEEEEHLLSEILIFVNKLIFLTAMLTS